MTEVEREALRMWREREMALPARVRRVHPDDLDRASGAWDLMLAAALARLKRGGKN